MPNGSRKKPAVFAIVPSQLAQGSQPPPSSLNAGPSTSPTMSAVLRRAQIGLTHLPVLDVLRPDAVSLERPSGADPRRSRYRPQSSARWCSSDVVADSACQADSSSHACVPVDGPNQVSRSRSMRSSRNSSSATIASHAALRVRSGLSRIPRNGGRLCPSRPGPAGPIVGHQRPSGAHIRPRITHIHAHPTGLDRRLSVPEAPPLHTREVAGSKPAAPIQRTPGSRPDIPQRDLHPTKRRALPLAPTREGYGWTGGGVH